MPCTAGETSIVIDHNGRFRACEMRGIVGDLHDYDFDVRRALASTGMRAEVDAIPKANCWCTHSCFIQDSSKFLREGAIAEHSAGGAAGGVRGTSADVGRSKPAPPPHEEPAIADTSETAESLADSRQRMNVEPRSDATMLGMHAGRAETGIGRHADPPTRRN